MTRRSIAAGAAGAVIAAALLGGCHDRRPSSQGGPTEAALGPAALLNALRARPASPIEPPLARGFQADPDGLSPQFLGGETGLPARVRFAARATAPVKIADRASGATVDVSLVGARDAAAQTVEGFVIYPRAHRSGATVVHRALPDGTEDFLSFETPPTASQVEYDLVLGGGVAGLRLVSGTLEILDAAGAPRLRVAPPYLVGADGARTGATLTIGGCAFDRDPAPPWGRPVISPGASSCRVRVAWDDGTVVYPAVLDPRWTTTGTMTSVRRDHTATRLSSNKVLVAGGRTSATSTTGLASAELYDPATNTWAATASMAAGRWSASATQLNASSNGTTGGKVLIAGGLNGSASLSTAELYAASAGTWTGAANLNAARALHTATLMPNGSVLIAGGVNGTTVLNTAAIFNPASGTGTWTAVATNMTSARQFHSASLLVSGNASFNNKVLIAGGNSGGTTSLTSVQLFDTSALTWSTTTALPSAREGHAATALASGNVLVTGGKSGSTVLATALVFTIPSSGTGATWASAGTMTSARAAHTATLLAAGIAANGTVLVAGGSSGTTTLATTELWNGTTSWTATTALSSPVQSHTASLLATGAVLIAGGVNGTATLGAAAVFDPSFALSCTSNNQCANGFCVNGVCCDTACTGTCGACNLAGKVGTCSPLATGTTCRSAAGPCDVAETCNGTSLSCPNDAFASATTVCRAAAGECDAAETCTGTASTCPADARKGNGMACTDDGNPCTTDLCDGVNAACQHAAGNNGTACPDDGNPCTTDRCNGTSTACQHAAGNNGTACPDDGNPCTTDRCNGTSTTCQHAAGNNGTACTDDGNPCTTDHCDGVNTTCQHPAGNSGMPCRPASGACDVAETCNGVSPSCPADAKQPNGTNCNDGNACTNGDTCQAGACTGGAAVTCSGADQCHTVGACVPATGCPAPVAKANGTTCNDGNACTTGETCQGGACAAGTTVTCSGADQCHTVGACVPATGCPAPVAKANGTTCNDGNACTTGETCQAGACAAGTTVTCSAQDQCHAVGTCSPTAGCSNPPLPNGTACSDGNVCTQADACQAGVCQGTAVACSGADACHTVGACVPGVGCPAPVVKPDGASCDDGNACTRTDVCESGACVGANAVTCVAPDGCHTASCDRATGACKTTTLAGTCDLGAFDYDKAGRLVRDRGTELKYDGYDQLRQVIPVATPPALANLAVDDLEIDGETQALAGGLNARGHVALSATLASGTSHGVLFKGTQAPEDINVAAGVSTSVVAAAVNDADTVGGTWTAADGTSHVFRFDDQTGFHDLGKVGDGAVALDINASNQLTGSFSASGLAHGYRLSDATGFEEIGTLGGAQSWGWSIDDLGVVAASAQTATSPADGLARFGHAVLFHDVIGLEDLNALVDPMRGTTLVVANEHRGNWVVGAEVIGGLEHGYRLNTATGALDEMTWNGLTTATGLNDAGDVVGWGYLDAANSQQAAWIVSDRTGFVKLNDLIDPAGGWDLRVANAIDDLGDVTGWGFHNGRVSAFLLRVPIHTSGSGGPAIAEAHTYGFDGLRTSTTTAPGTPNARVQMWFTQDYSQHDGIREHYLRVGDRLVARVTMQPVGGGGAGAGRLATRNPDSRGGAAFPRSSIAAALMLAALGGLFFGFAKRRRRWIPGVAALASLVLGAASCGMLGLSEDSRSLNWTIGTNLTHFFHQGISAGPTLITDANGALVEERRYEPFGQPIPTVNVVAEPQNILGKLTDPNTGWSYHGARWMQPQTARWTAPDSATKAPDPKHMVAPWDLNPYAYAGQNPAQLWDPDGAADLPITSERYADVARDFIGQHGYEPNVVQLMEHEKEMEAAGVFGARDRTIDKFTMNDAIARGIEWAEREYMINAATGYGGKLIFFGGKAVGGAAIRSAILASRATVALSFMIRGGVKVSNALRYLKGFDLGRPVVVRTLQKGTIIVQWVNKETGLVGRWFAPVGTKMTELGIEGKRGVQLFRVNRDIEVLEGTAADFPSASGGEMLPGGGQQYFLGSDVPTEVTDPLPVPAGGPPLPGMTPPAPGP